MVKELNFDSFMDEFNKSHEHSNRYSYGALQEIHEWYETHDPNYRLDIGEVVEIWSDYPSFQRLEADFSYLISNDQEYEEMDEEEKADHLIKLIEKRQGIIHRYNDDNSFILQKY